MSRAGATLEPSTLLALPSRLYGRDAEVAALSRWFSAIAAGQGLVALVSGPSGSGKTALVQALEEPIRAANGRFLHGKFNQYQLGMPLFALRQALGGLGRELLAMEADERRGWQLRLCEAVGDLGRLLTDLVPEFEALLGDQPAVPDIGPLEAPHRFARVLRRFLAVFCQAEHPLVLFLDDCQWADAASLAVLCQLEIHATLRYLFVIVSYRDNEVDSSHPLVEATEDLLRHGVPLERLSVPNLTLADVEAVVAGILPPAVIDLPGLARGVAARTDGNAFHLRALLEDLCAGGEIGYDADAAGWRWRFRTGEGPQVDDVPHLFARRLQSLPEACRRLLAHAACVGNRFDVETLSVAAACPAAQCRELLQQGVDAGLLRPLDDQPGSFVFWHDRVQQAAHALIAPGDLAAVRLTIGRLLLSRLGAEPLDERLLEITEHLNAGQALIDDPAEIIHLVQLNQAAGAQARTATAYRAMRHFHRAAGMLLERAGLAESFWENHHSQALRLFVNWAESEFIQGDPERGEECVRAALPHCRGALEQAAVLGVLIVHHTLLARYADAIAAGRQALAALGFALPDGNFEAARDAAIAQVRADLAGASPLKFLQAPALTDPNVLAVVQVLIAMGPPCYRSHARLWAVIVPRVVSLTLRHGPVPQIGYSHTAFGGLLGWVANDYATARQFGQLATGLMRDVFTAPSDHSVFHLMIGSSLRHWFEPLAAAAEDYVRAWETGLRSGNLQYAAYAFGHSMYCRFWQGVPLVDLIEESQRSLEFSRTRTNQWAIDLLEGGLQVFRALAGTAAATSAAASWSESQYLEAVAARHNTQVSCIYRVLKASALLVLGQFEAALSLSDAAAPLIYTVGTQGLLPWPEHVFTRALLLCLQRHSAAPAQQAAWRAEVGQLQAQVAIWSEHSPATYVPKQLLIAAEVARWDAQPARALGLCHQAIEAARSSQFNQWEGLGHERAADLAYEHGEPRLAQIHWEEAYACYARWGAGAKLQAMEAQWQAPLVRGALAEPGTSMVAAVTSLSPWCQRHFASLRARAARHVGVVDGHGVPDPDQIVRELSQATAHLRQEVAERKQMETRLRESEARFRSMFFDAPMGVALLAVDTGVVYEANPRFVAITGVGKGERFTLAMASTSASPDDDAWFNPAMPVRPGAADNLAVPRRYRRADGDERWLTMTVARAGDSVPPRHLCMVDDATERQQSEASLEAARRWQVTEKSLRLAIASMAVPEDLLQVVAECGLQFRHSGGSPFDSLTLQVFNRDGLDVVSLDPARPVARLPLWSQGTAWTGPGTPPAQHTWLALVCQGGAPRYEPAAAEGGPWTAGTSVLAVPFSHGALVVHCILSHAFTPTDVALLLRIAAVVSDGFQRFIDLVHRRQADRRQAAAAVVQQIRNRVLRMECEEDVAAVVGLVEAELARLFPDCRCTVDLAAGLRPTALDPAASGPDEKRLAVASGGDGGDAEGGAATPGPDVWPDRPTGPDGDRNHPTTGPETVALPFSHGTLRVAAAADAILGDAEVESLRHFAQVLTETHHRLADIARRDQLSEQVQRQRLQALEANRLQTLGEMAAGIAHELNQPLNGIRAFAEGSLYGIRQGWPTPPDAVAETLGDIISQVDRITEIVDHMRVFARVGSGPDLVAVAISDVVGGALKLVSAQLRSHGIGVTVDVPPGLPLVLGHRNQLEQVVLNLIANARDALDSCRAQAAPKPAWSANLNLVGAVVEDGHTVALSVADNGGGIATEVLTRVFDPFFTTKEVGKGTGLGLSITRSIIERHHGRIEVDNRPGDGVTFTLLLPVVVDAAVTGGAPGY
jgi:PAS domain S-box-containing protein